MQDGAKIYFENQPDFGDFDDFGDFLPFGDFGVLGECLCSGLDPLEEDDPSDDDGLEGVPEDGLEIEPDDGLELELEDGLDGLDPLLELELELEPLSGLPHVEHG